MPRFNAPPPNGDNRKAIEQRAREATRPVVSQERVRWPFTVRDMSNADSASEMPEASVGRGKSA